MSDFLQQSIEHYRQLHAERPGIFTGTHFLTSLPRIQELWSRCMQYTQEGPRNGRILDFGCGKGEQYRQKEYALGDKKYPTLAAAMSAPGWCQLQRLVTEIVGYDPCVAEYAAEPAGKFGMTICVDVLNSIPLPALDATVARICDLTEDVIFVRTTLAEGKKKLNDPYWEKYGRTIADYVQAFDKALDSDRGKHDCEVWLEIQTSHTGRADWITLTRGSMNRRMDYDQWEFHTGKVEL